MHATSLDPEFRDGATHAIVETQGIIAVCLEGEFDLANAEALGSQLEQALADGAGLIVDLSEASFIDSTVIQVLVRTAKAATTAHKTTVLQVQQATAVERTLATVGIERLIPLAHNRHEAVQIINKETVEGADSWATRDD